jgi:gliding motility-associated-like protein
MTKFTSVLLVLLCAAFITKAQPPCQTVIANITNTSPAADPIDTTTIKICKGTTVTFAGNGTFSNSGVGATYQWHFNDGTVQVGTTASKNFPNEGVYVVDFIVTDANGCGNKNCNSRRVIQVSTTPHFNQSVIPDSVCMNKYSTLQGIVTPVPGIYNCAPPVADTTFLPDGNGVSYTTSIGVSCFTPCDTVRDSTDIESICLNMEHSYIGDLIVSITCPNGQSALLFNGNGASQLGTYLGEPNDESCGAVQNMIPGVGYTYCFSPTATWGTFVAECNLSNWVPNVGCLPSNSMAPGSYRPEASYNNLVGCPLNGNWTITVTDDQSSDNGFIFFWDITFSQTLGNYAFMPTYPQQFWSASPDIVGSANASSVVIKPTTSGTHCYTFHAIDAFHCPYDSTFCLQVIDPGNPGLDSTAKICLNQDSVNAFNYLRNNPDPGGVWSGTGVSPDGSFNPSTVGVGTYPVQYKLSKWHCDTTATVTFHVVNNVNIDFSFSVGLGCTADTIHLTNLSDSGKYWWNYGDGTMPDDTTLNAVHIYQDQGVYEVRLKVQNLEGCVDSAVKVVDVKHPLIAAFSSNIDSVCQTEGTPIQFTDASIGNVAAWKWTFNDGGSSSLQNPTHTYTLAGMRQVKLTINDNIPCFDTVVHYIYVDSVPFIKLHVDRHAICTGEAINVSSDYLHPAVNLIWDFGDGTHWNQAEASTHSYDNPGVYYFFVTGDYPVCAAVTDRDSVVVNAYPKVNLGPDTVLCLDGPAITVTDLNNTNDPQMHFLWNTGATTPSIDIVHPGKYSMTATKNDCATTENITVNKDCYTDMPNAFTPNGDGVNDYFYPRQLLSLGLTNFSMMIYDRWGQKVFETTNTNGRGWDGKFNGKDQPMGVYIYQITATMQNGRVEKYSGNITLVR